MKKPFLLFALLPATLCGQSLVSTQAGNRTVLLEDFTGIKCVWCPDGHVIMANIAAAHPGAVSLVGVHAGFFATPSAGQPDFRTVYGDTLNAFFGVTAYPSGVINRHSFGGISVLNRGQWMDACAEVLGMPSPVNLGVESHFDGGTRELTVHVQLYYTADSPQGEDRINVLLTENHITGFQVTPNGDDLTYDHQHVLRTYLTEIWGDPVATTTTGTIVDRTYTYTVPDEWNISNCEVTAFVGEERTEVYQARTVRADDGATVVAGALGSLGNNFQGGVPETGTGFSAPFHNLSGSSAAFIVELEPLNAPDSWTTVIQVDGAPVGSGSTITLEDAASVLIDVTITPDFTAGIGNYRLSLTSVDFPDADPMQKDLHVISGVQDLVVSNPDAMPWNDLYEASMQQAGETLYALCTRDEFIRFGQANALGNVLNIYRNVSWTFPSITEAEVTILASLMDNGVNLMIAGQDIGWDQSGDPNAYGTTLTRSFYSEYMLATYVNDGSPSNNQVRFNTGDPVFGSVPNSNVAHVFGNGYTYPDEIIPVEPASPIITYNATEKIGALRAKTDHYKLVYFGIGPEQMADANVGRMMIQLSHDWFYGLVGIGQIDALSTLLGQAYPVPADRALNIPLHHPPGNGTLDVFDATGRLVLSRAVKGEVIVTLDTGSLDNGLYNFIFRTAQGAGTAQPFIVAH